jgi:hypothetical protein
MRRGLSQQYFRQHLKGLITIASLPFDGETSWGDVLNTYLTALSGEATSTQTGLQNHSSNIPSDPHGDRAYAQSLVSPFTTGLNAANGLVKLNGSGTIPSSLITSSSSIGGMYTAIVDAVSMFGIVSGTNTDQSPGLQSAMNYISGLGGGIVYIGPGTFSVSSPIYIGSNTWVIMSPGTVIQRIPGSPTAPYIFTNIQLTNTSTPASNIRITGGNLNAIGSFSIATACTLIELFQGNNHIIEDVQFYAPAGNSHAIEFNGVPGGYVNNCTFNGVSTNSAVYNSCVLVSSSTSANSPSGLNPTLFTGQYCYGITVNNSSVQLPSVGYTYAAYGCLVGSDASNSSTVGVQGLTITGNGFGAPAPNGPVYQASASWQQVILTGNSWGDGKGTSASINVNISIPYDTWTTCSLNSGFSNVSGNYPLQYKISQDGTVTVMGMVHLPNSGFNGTITTLPYHPTHPVYAPMAWVGASVGAVFTEVDTSGHLTLQQANAGGTNVFINTTFPADFSGNGLNT